MLFYAMDDAIVFTERQFAIIEGSLLGDAWINDPKYGNSAFIKPQAKKNKTYLRWHFKELEPFSCSLKDYDNWVKYKLYYRSTFRTKASSVFSKLRQRWYPNGIKIVPSDLRLSPLAVAIWFFDDGSNEVKARVCKFATYCFQREECEFLVDRLDKQFGIKCYVGGRNVIFVRAESYKAIVDLVEPYMLWNCFKHKIRYRDAEFQKITDAEAVEIFSLHKTGKSLTEISKLVCRSKSAVSAILRGTRKNHLGLSTALPGVTMTSKSGVRGISWDSERSKWQVHLAGKYLGRFQSLEEAKNVLCERQAKLA